MKVVTWNVNGLRSVFAKDHRAFQELVEKEAPDVLCLQEIKCDEKQCVHVVEYMTGRGYQSCIINPALKAGYSGTATFSKLPLKLIDKNVSDPEGRIIVAEIAKTIIVNLYVPNSKADLSRLKERTEKWEYDIRTLVNNLKKDNPRKAIVICGDLNVAPEEIDLKNAAGNRGKHGFTNEERSAFRELLAECNLCDTFRTVHPTLAKYSWFSPFARSRERNVGWRIDLMLLTKQHAKKIESADIMCNYLGSDHCPCVLQLT